MTVVHVSPSELRYLYAKCKRCWWLKNKKVELPKEVTPKVFNTMDEAMKATISVDVAKDLGIPAVAEIPLGKIETDFLFEDLDCKIRIHSRLDKAFELEGGTVGIVDFKVSNFRDDQAGQFWGQLMSYLSCIEDPKGLNREVSQIGLVPFAVGSMSLHGADEGGYLRAAQRGTLRYVPLEIDRAMFERDIYDIAKIAVGPMPEAGELCGTCRAVSEIIDYMKRAEKKAVAA